MFPLLGRLREYNRSDFSSDLIAGAIVAVMLVPQAMAYAMLAGLPPQIGLYASIVPLVLYSLFGTSNTLAVGPVAMVSLLVVSGVGELAEVGSPKFIGYCLTLAMMIGVIQILMAILRLGFLVNFISHPVLVGFTSAAAIAIGTSQLKHLLGVAVPKTEYPFEMIWETLYASLETNGLTLAIGVASIGLLLFFAYLASPILKRLGSSDSVSDRLSKLGPLLAVVTTAVAVAWFGLDQSADVGIVGSIPAGVPKLTMPPINFPLIRDLLPLATVITLVGYLESISVAKALASRRREKIDANRELFALGMADLGASFSVGYPVTGGFSRSLVNFSAGAKTPIAGLVTATLVVISVALLTPAFYYIPKTVLAAIIIVAVAGLVDFKTPIKLWRYSRADAIALIVTFLSVLGLGIETGILIGVVSTVVMLMWKMSRPHVAEIGRMKKGLGFRNIKRHDVETTPNVFAFRIDESLNFANAPFLESYVLEQLADRTNITDVLFVCSGVNDIDATGLEALELLYRELKEIGVGLYLSDVKGPVTDRFKLAGYEDEFLEERIFLTANEALTHLLNVNDRPSCP